jgi:hypothetical protein
MSTFETPRLTFVGVDPKIGALKAAITRVANNASKNGMSQGMSHGTSWWSRRFIALWQARNRRTRVLMRKVQRANA